MVRRGRIGKSLHERLTAVAKEARDKASRLPPGPERNSLLIKAQQAEAASQFDGPNLQAKRPSRDATRLRPPVVRYLEPAATRHRLRQTSLSGLRRWQSPSERLSPWSRCGAAGRTVGADVITNQAVCFLQQGGLKRGTGPNSGGDKMMQLFAAAAAAINLCPEKRWIDGSHRSLAALDLEPGTKHVLIAWRKKGGRRFAYDTAQIETLFIEFPELPIPTADWAELGWTRLGFQTGNLTLYFASITASGRIEVRWGRDFLTLLLRRRRAEICIDARFTDPLVDDFHTDTLEIDWTFSVDLQASAILASRTTASPTV
ncbi:hypothetical protein NLM33_14030 [Bradyrhizobium sp. CCGUVB1N3]|uniref:hypothetical protein n=1 Tax=Bradyrhizobium sp. CCGUVB1N3 TaxID=2949629 RepID=UPI0020B284F1|nr:hypothetical protein [Bradyrhizobium sp. CCGUVB1N3]MCP3471451.1 hypothetical protein [Bradyrhizobium sp. CCGUVB1N3]